jgi:hypothetical protein
MDELERGNALLLEGLLCPSFYFLQLEITCFSQKIDAFVFNIAPNVLICPSLESYSRVLL